MPEIKSKKDVWFNLLEFKPYKGKTNPILLDFPDILAYLSHKEPYFKVTIGNFYTKLEAKKVKQEISKKYNSYIVPSEIVIEN